MNNSSQGDPLATKEPVGTEDDVVGQRERSSTPSRAEAAAEQIAELARSAAPGTRLGSREELRALCGVSVGTLHEALRLLQSTSEIRSEEHTSELQSLMRTSYAVFCWEQKPTHNLY